MKTIVFAGGGTAGHVMPNLALIDGLKHKYNCVYAGGNGMEKSLCLSRGIPFYSIDTVKLRRDKFFSNFAVPFKLISCVNSAKRALDEIKPDLVFSKGGFAALPIVLAAKKIPVLCHESDFSPGLTTKLTKGKSERILCAFEDCARKIKKAEHCGTPLDQNLYKGKADRKAYGLSGAKPILTVIGGSSGAATLNSALISVLPELTKNFEIIHVTGKNKSVGDKKSGYSPIEFEYDMPRLYATSDIVVTRAGANALSECIALGIPTIAVPLEKASRGDQLQNARYFENKGALKVVRETADFIPALSAAVIEVFNSKSRYINAMKNLDIDGTKKIIRIIDQTLQT